MVEEYRASRSEVAAGTRNYPGYIALLEVVNGLNRRKPRYSEETIVEKRRKLQELTQDPKAMDSMVGTVDDALSKLVRIVEWQGKQHVYTRQQDILRMRFQLDKPGQPFMTLDSIGMNYGVSGTRVGQIVVKAAEKLGKIRPELLL